MKILGIPFLSFIEELGEAVDFFAYVDGKASWDKTHMTAIARHIQKRAFEKYGIKLIWGGDWRSFKDMPHLQLPKL